ncbi:hypothetical protein GCM10010168_63020 [Actinoplanes ianthinogenes]|uniref:Peptidase M20 dimerisation domain-containing protein n=1 Tax=Actinoplanes ianthinogenes TaxID=122358 RepID=A0ABN6C1N6_9ACTN|nr:M20/M25/M40 family metallo-hydrolase [Actinoplanes ianthinogenes]BCJ39450.1 hypothetical protein Aiant_01070 [Actinoplanes ianthinogenes]GGR36016.1 hypothetical protein GCM10010168_63020 [Actinoplanes ianthinogenes]
MSTPQLVMAREDAASVVALTRELVAVPSRGGIDDYEPVVGHLRDWFGVRKMASSVLTDADRRPIAVVCDVRGERSGPHYVLNACLDTAPFGDEERWTHPPTAAVVEGDFLYGRGSADAKSGIAIFCHLAARLVAARHLMHGTLTLLFDLDEHTGGFAGAKAYFEGPAAGTIDGVMIGYPGLEHLVVGGRGVHRVRLHVAGVASHSGGRAGTPNAIVKAADLIRDLAAADLGASGAKVTVTEVGGGSGFSVTPDRCTLGVDIRTTPGFDAAALLRTTVTAVDRRWPGTAPTTVEQVTVWPPYALDADAPLRAAILGAAAVHGLDVTPKVAGPSNIGNYLAGLGIPATAGFGVAHDGLHATDERIFIPSIPLVQATYHAAVLALL